MFRKYTNLLIIIILTFQIKVQSQNRENLISAIPELAKITHFDRTDYKGDSQFWTMVRDSTGIYYFGNNDGALVYNGQRWQDMRLPNSSAVRSLLYASNGIVYAGGYNDFGIVEKNSFGNYEFRSILIDLKIDTEKIENVWQIHEVNGNIIFRTFQGLITIENNSSSYIPSESKFIYADVLGDTYFVQDENLGVMSFDPVLKRFKSIFDSKAINNEAIISFLPSDKTNFIEIVTQSGNIYVGNLANGVVTDKYKVFSEDQNESLSVAIKKEDTYILGTIGSKILTFSKGRNTSLKGSIYDQIQDNTVLNFYEDGDELWVLLNDGIDLIKYNASFSNLFKGGSVYDILIKDEFIYIATNNGVYFSKIPNEDSVFNFIKTKIPQGQAWSLSNIGASILVSHDLGLYEISDEGVNQIGNEKGFWKVVPIPNKNSEYLACNYNGFYLLHKEGTKFNLTTKIKGFQESTRDILPSDEENTFWVCHGFKGVFKVKFSEDYRRVLAIDHFTDQNGFKSPFNINVHNWNSEIVFSTNNGFYTFNKENNEFIPYTKLNDIIGNSVNTRKIITHQDTTWVVIDDEIGLFKQSEELPNIDKNTFRNLKGDLNRGFEKILPLTNKKVLVGSKSGLYVYNLKESQDKSSFSTLITKVTKQESAKSEASKVVLTEQNELEISNSTEILRFEFASPKKTPMSNINFSYKLKDLDNDWSRWSSNSFKEYTHLPAGTYEFLVRSGDEKGIIGTEASFTFIIKPLWYQTNFAKIMYSILMILIIWLGLRLINNKIIEERKKSKDLLERSKKVLNLEIERLKLKQDKNQLEEDVIFKSKELTNYTVQLINKKQAFAEVQNDLKELKSLVKNAESKKKLVEIFKKLHQHKLGEEYMKVYDVNFEKIHQDFFKKLKYIHPKITTRELRLCAFIKMNLTNKEIAPLLNISVRGVETARYRVRKKLQIDQESSFNDFLLNL